MGRKIQVHKRFTFEGEGGGNSRGTRAENNRVQPSHSFSEILLGTFLGSAIILIAVVILKMFSG